MASLEITQKSSDNKPWHTPPWDPWEVDTKQVISTPAIIMATLSPCITYSL